MEKILAFGAHPDDVEFQCAGTLALLSQQGYEIHIAVMAGGECGSATLAPEEIREIRLKEGERAAAVLDGHFHYAGGHDVEIEYNSQYRRRAIRVLREIDPFLVFTCPPMDYLIDHEETSRLVRNACFIAPVPNYDCGVPTNPTEAVPHLYYWNAMGGRDIFGRELALTCAVDISSVMEIKTKMLSCHASQREWLAHHHHYDRYLEIMKNNAVKEGERAGFEAAESFIQHRGDGYPQDNILKTILGDFCKEF